MRQACKQLADAARRIAEAIGRYILNLAQERKREREAAEAAARRDMEVEGQSQLAQNVAEWRKSLEIPDPDEGIDNDPF